VRNKEEDEYFWFMQNYSGKTAEVDSAEIWQEAVTRLEWFCVGINTNQIYEIGSNNQPSIENLQIVLVSQAIQFC
jgi:hypothetical protein